MVIKADTLTTQTRALFFYFHYWVVLVTVVVPVISINDYRHAYRTLLGLRNPSKPVIIEFSVIPKPKTRAPVQRWLRKLSSLGNPFPSYHLAGPSPKNEQKGSVPVAKSVTLRCPSEEQNYEMETFKWLKYLNKSFSSLLNANFKTKQIMWREKVLFLVSMRNWSQMSFVFVCY